MKLDFTLLVVDDAPENIGSAISLLEDHLDSLGFALIRVVAPLLTDRGLHQIASDDGRSYDLVIVDFNLGQPDIDGAKAARRLRSELPYTDMVFYSSNSESNLLGELAQESVAGVFVAIREQLDDALIGIADTVIGKAVDLNHMRGIAMAEVAEMDILILDALRPSLEYRDNPCIERAVVKTGRRLRESMTQQSRRLNRRLEEDGLANMVTDSRLVSSLQKFQVLMRIAECLDDPPQEALDSLKDYKSDILDNRNVLAHVREEPTVNGATVLRSLLGDADQIVDDHWMSQFRNKLRTHRKSLTIVHDAVLSQFGSTSDPD